ncbi:MAG: DUF1616 domain-containing protein [Solirubrobacteraceae bacterium]
MTGSKPLRVRGDLMAVLVAGCIAAVAAVVTLPHMQALRTAVGVPFLLFGQGYAVMSALFARELPEPSVRVLLAFTLSVATIIAVSLVLAAAGVPLTGPALVVGLLLVAFVAVVVGTIRQPIDAVSQGRISVGNVARSRWLWSSLVAVGAFVVLLIALSRALPNTSVAGYTTLWALRGPSGDVTVGVASAEHSRAAYRVVASAASGKIVSVTIKLAPGRQWTQALSIAGPPLQTVDVRLYRLAHPTVVYREVTLRA